MSIRVEGNFAFSEDHISNIKGSFLSLLYPLILGISELSVFHFGGFSLAEVFCFSLLSYFLLCSLKNFVVFMFLL